MTTPAKRNLRAEANERGALRARIAKLQAESLHEIRAGDVRKAHPLIAKRMRLEVYAAQLSRWHRRTED